ncbi:adenylate kinase, partial [Salmonella enterica subsp. enterica serovar Newport]|nr:adenylate kinase [Salmonella enterica subsp. enterica serovar Newport]
MRRVLIVGCPGAGKSTLAKELANITKLPLIHLDRYYWLPGW